MLREASEQRDVYIEKVMELELRIQQSVANHETEVLDYLDKLWRLDEANEAGRQQLVLMESFQSKQRQDKDLLLQLLHELEGIKEELSEDKQALLTENNESRQRIDHLEDHVVGLTSQVEALEEEKHKAEVSLSVSIRRLDDLCEEL